MGILLDYEQTNILKYIKQDYGCKILDVRH